jgi:hypothetical protein
MTPDELVRRRVSDDLTFAYREAAAAARLAYDQWRRRQCAEAFAAYRAAQDRADAAQDALAHWVRTQVASDRDRPSRSGTTPSRRTSRPA